MRGSLKSGRLAKTGIGAIGVGIRCVAKHGLPGATVWLLRERLGNAADTLRSRLSSRIRLQLELDGAYLVVLLFSFQLTFFFRTTLGLLLSFLFAFIFISHSYFTVLDNECSLALEHSSNGSSGGPDGREQPTQDAYRTGDGNGGK